ncbi:hypothetical protein [Parasphingorhabdus pacifica]
MRTAFLHGEVDQYTEVKQSLIELFVNACAEPGDDTAELVELLLDDKLTRDGLLARWREPDVRRFLVEVVPRVLVLDDWSGPPRVLHRWIDFLAGIGLLMESTGSEAVHAAIDRATPDYLAAMVEPAAWGVTKFFTVAMREHGVDPEDEEAVAEFFLAVESGEAGLDRDLVADVEQRESTDTPKSPAYWLPPMLLPEENTPDVEAPRSALLPLVLALQEWVGSGRDLDAGRLSESDLNELTAKLAELVDGGVGRFTTRMLVEWSERANLLRVAGKRLVRTQVSEPLLAEPGLLWTRLWYSFARCEDVFGADVGALALLGGDGEAFADLVREVLCALYSQTDALPLEILVNTTVSSMRTDVADGSRTAPVRETVRRMLGRMLDQWELMGVVRSFTTSDAEDIANIDAATPDEVRADRTMVELLPLGLWAARESLRSAGLLAPSVQDVVDCPIEVLVLAMPTSPPDAVEAAIAAWIADRGGAEAASAEVADLLCRVDDPAVRLSALWLLEHTGTAGQDAVLGLCEDPVAGPAARMWLWPRPVAEAVQPRPGDELLFALDGMGLTALDDPELFLAEFRQRTSPNQLAMIEEIPRSTHSRAGVVLEVLARLHPDERMVRAAIRSLERIRGNRDPA